MTLVVLLLARFVRLLVLAALDRGFRVRPSETRRYPGLAERANRYYPLLRGAVSIALRLITLFALLEVWGLGAFSWFAPGQLGGRVVSAAITIVVTLVLAIFCWEMVNIGIERQLTKLGREEQIVRLARLRTLQPMLRTALAGGIVTLVGLTVLSEIGVNIAPLLAGAGIVGVAVGFGSQKLVQDFITGIFLLLENAMQVGDWVTVAGLSGSVEDLSIRTIRLRAGDGSVHVIPFSAVTTVTNINRGQGNAAVSVSIGAHEDTDRISDVLRDIAATLRADETFAPRIRGDLDLWGVDKIEGSVVTIAGQIACTDSGRWSVQREFNRRLKQKFDELGIPFANPTQTVLVQQVPVEHRPTPTAEPITPQPPPDESPPPAALGNTS